MLVPVATCKSRGTTAFILEKYKLLAPVDCFADPVYTSLWAVWEDQHAQYTWFLPQTSQEGNACSIYITNARYICCLFVTTMMSSYLVLKFWSNSEFFVIPSEYCHSFRIISFQIFVILNNSRTSHIQRARKLASRALHIWEHKRSYELTVLIYIMSTGYKIWIIIVSLIKKLPTMQFWRTFQTELHF